MVDAAGFGMSAAINTATFTVFVLAFLMLRKHYPAVYTPRFLPFNRFAKTPPPPPASVSNVDFVKQIISMTDADFLRYAGLDAFMFIKFLRVCFQLFAAITIFGVGILVPINYTANGGVDDFESLSVSNIPSESHRLWAHWVCAYLFYGLFYYLTWRVWQQYVDLRVIFLAERHLQQQNISILVHNLPESIRSDKALFDAYNEIFPDQVHSAQLACDSTEFKEDIDERDQCLMKLEHALVEYSKNPTKKPQAATKCFCCNKVDAIEHYTTQVERLNMTIALHKKAAPKYVKCGFVTFNSVTAMEIACNTEMNHIPFQFRSKPAPEPQDVYWPSLNISDWSLLIRNILIPIALFFFVFFWIIPVAFIQSIATLSNLEAKAPFLSPVLDWSPAVIGIIEGYLPSLILAVFNILLPIILLKMSQIQGIEANSWLQFSVLRKFYVFQLFNTFLISAIASSIFDELQDLIDNPTSIPTILGQTIPQSATFFVTYLLVTSLTVLPGQLLRIVDVIVYGLKRRFLVKTWREKEALYGADGYSYGKNAPIHLLAFTVAISFCVIAPIISPFAVIYFVIAYSICKYQFVYVWFTRFETGGLIWETVFQKLCISTFVSQLILVGVFGLKKYPAGTVLLVPLIFLTPIFYYAIIRSYKPKCKLLPSTYAVRVDSILHQRLTEQVAQYKALTTPPQTPKEHYTGEAESEKVDNTSSAQLMPRRPLNTVSSDSNFSQSQLNSPAGSSLRKLGVHSDLLTTSSQAFAMPVYRQLEFAVDTHVAPPASADGLDESVISFEGLQQSVSRNRSQTWSDVERGMGGSITEESNLGHVRIDSPKTY